MTFKINSLDHTDTSNLKDSPHYSDSAVQHASDFTISNIGIRLSLKT
jgi:hypothetical protein